MCRVWGFGVQGFRFRLHRGLGWFRVYGLQVSVFRASVFLNLFVFLVSCFWFVLGASATWRPDPGRQTRVWVESSKSSGRLGENSTSSSITHKHVVHASGLAVRILNLQPTHNTCYSGSGARQQDAFPLLRGCHGCDECSCLTTCGGGNVALCSRSLIRVTEK